VRALALLTALLVCGTAGAASVRPSLRPGWNDTPAQWSSDGARILYRASWDAPKDGFDFGFGLVGRDGRPDARLVPPLPVDEDWWRSATLSSDGRRLLVTEQPSAVDSSRVSVFVRELATGVDQQLTPDGEEGAHGAGWSPDGSRVLVVQDGELLSERPDGSDVQQAAAPTVLDARYLRDGSIAVVRRGPQFGSWVGVVPATGGAVRRLTPDNDSELVAPSPDGKRLLLVRGEASLEVPNLVVVDVASGRQRQIARGSQGTWSPDGRRIAYVRRDGIRVVGADGSGDHAIRTGGRAPAWSPRGDVIAFADRGECNEEGIFTMRPDGSGVRRLTSICRLVGTPGPDTIAGTNSRDVIRALGGDDRIDANPGNKLKPYYGHPDADDVDAGPGDDTIDVREGWLSRDHVRCGSGDDRVIADRIDVVARDCEHVALR